MRRELQNSLADSERGSNKAASAVMPLNPKLDLARERLLGLEAKTTSQQARPMQDRLCAWRNEVRSASTATALARLL